MLTTRPPRSRGDRSEMSASPTWRVTPVLVPPVRIQAPAVLAVRSNPLGIRRDVESTLYRINLWQGSGTFAEDPFEPWVEFKVGLSSVDGDDEFRKFEAPFPGEQLEYEVRPGVKTEPNVLRLVRMRAPEEIDCAIRIRWRAGRMASRTPNGVWSHEVSFNQRGLRRKYYQTSPVWPTPSTP